MSPRHKEPPRAAMHRGSRIDDPSTGRRNGRTRTATESPEWARHACEMRKRQPGPAGEHTWGSAHETNAGSSQPGPPDIGDPARATLPRKSRYRWLAVGVCRIMARATPVICASSASGSAWAGCPSWHSSGGGAFTPRAAQAQRSSRSRKAGRSSGAHSGGTPQGPASPRLAVSTCANNPSLLSKASLRPGRKPSSMG